MVGAYGGGRLAAYVPGTGLLVAFALMAFATAVAMLRGPRAAKAAGTAPADVPVRHVVAVGLVVGAVTGLVGSGGGFLVVPALALLGGLPMSAAVGTSLLVIALNSLSGLAGHLADVRVDWHLVLMLTGAAVVGSLIGGRFAGRVSQDSLRTAFGWFVVVMGVLVLGRQLPAAIWAHPLTWAGAGLAGATAVTWGAVRVRRPRPVVDAPRARSRESAARS
ncbi:MULTISPECIES: sulfite exporter TauE/SafE family protein [Streptomyces]|uniref:Probable membrane transporter protein n=2 Tax=Streptomyces TaxID=1883 RepID=A0ABU4KGF0_9ACTN|nr:sulfite exporter TauE/SafE family protein [Streptomyces roseolus]MDX2296873.1 sulfite exporter TauE/SafE family protein [Streptomyces roseolus]